VWEETTNERKNYGQQPAEEKIYHTQENTQEQAVEGSDLSDAVHFNI
jgi:hypothetical protein